MARHEPRLPHTTRLNLNQNNDFPALPGPRRNSTLLDNIPPNVTSQDMTTNRTFVFDAETVSQPLDRLEASMPEFTAAKNLRDPEKIAADIAQKREAWLEKAPLRWQHAQVACIAIGELVDGVPQVECHWDERDREEVILARFLSHLSAALAEGHRVGGHNIKAFDLPMVINRARVHRIQVPCNLYTIRNRYPIWHDGIFDTLDHIGFGETEGNGVDAIAAALGLPAKLGSGKDFPLLWATDRPAAIEYNKQDVRIELLIAERLGI